jgi:uncharacterized membrane protein YeiH
MPNTLNIPQPRCLRQCVPKAELSLPNEVKEQPASAAFKYARPLVRGADLAGTFVFAFQGALAAIAAHLDLFGDMVLAFATALGGGVIRDVLMGELPPSALRDWAYPSTAFLAAAIVFMLAGHVQVPRELLLTLDAGGLALFAVAGTQKALDARIHPLSAVLLGTITAVGGGTLRDLLLTHVPAILRIDVYATAALFGALVLIVARRAGAPRTAAALLGGLACFTLRMVAISQHWQLPGSAAAG